MKRKISIGVVSILLLVVALSAIQCAGTTEFQRAKQVAYATKVTWGSIQKIAAVAYLDWEDSQLRGIEPPLIYMDEERLEKFREIDQKVLLAHSTYVNALKIIEIAGDEPEPIDLFMAKAELAGMMTSGIALLESFGVIGKGAFSVNNTDASISSN